MRLRILIFILMVACAALVYRYCLREPSRREMEAMLRDAVVGADGTFADRARVGINILVRNPSQTSFGAVLSYRDRAVGRDNFEGDSLAVVTQMRELLKHKRDIAVTCLAWHYQTGRLTLYGGAAYGTETGVRTIRNGEKPREP